MFPMLDIELGSYQLRFVHMSGRMDCNCWWSVFCVVHWKYNWCQVQVPSFLVTQKIRLKCISDCFVISFYKSIRLGSIRQRCYMLYVILLTHFLEFLSCVGCPIISLNTAGENHAGIQHSLRTQNTESEESIYGYLDIFIAFWCFRERTNGISIPFWENEWSRGVQYHRDSLQISVYRKSAISSKLWVPLQTTFSQCPNVQQVGHHGNG